MYNQCLINNNQKVALLWHLEKQKWIIIILCSVYCWLCILFKYFLNVIITSLPGNDRWTPFTFVTRPADTDSLSMVNLRKIYGHCNEIMGSWCRRLSLPISLTSKVLHWCILCHIILERADSSRTNQNHFNSD